MKTIAIIGRPNVGKSTLFNRLIESNKAITQKTPGVTRDRQYGTCLWEGHQFAVIDTGGYTNNSEDHFEKEIKNQIDIAIQDSDAIFFILDSREGLTKYDQDLAPILRKSGKKIFLIANKTDSLNLNLVSNEFYKLGFGELYQIAAINGYGTGDLLDSVIEHTCLDVETEKEIQSQELPKIAIVGRPNVGKSSLLNLLIGNNRSIVTPISGTTRDTTDSVYNLYGKKFIITDTAGLRKKSKVHDDIEFYSTVRSIKAIQNSDVCIVMICANEGLTSQDMHIIAIAQKHKKGIVLVINKWDLVEKDHNTMKSFKKDLINNLGPYQHIPIIFTSVLDKQRIHKSIDLALKIYEKKNAKIPTSALNEVVKKIVTKYPPPSYRGKDIKLKYATQLPTRNQAIALFSNFPQHIKQNYKSYLEKQIRQNFDLQGIPIDIFFRKS